MFDAPLDAWYVWIGLSMVSVAVAGTALGLPTATAPAATPVAETIDSVAASPNQARATVALTADRIRLARHSVALESAGGVDRAPIAFGPVVPADTRALHEVVAGRAPERAFLTKHAFEAAIEEARRAAPRWESAPKRLTVRRVRWGDVNVTLVG